MYLEKSSNRRLFTYKVAYDKGVAPNPYCGVCTLAICKPKIRSAAKKEDIIVGFGCGKDSGRIVYCMVVDKKLSWHEYTELCKSDAMLRGKIPNNEFEPGDCIWISDENGGYKCLPSWSGHGEDAYQRDVLDGKNVLLGGKFWYFGRGDQYEIILPPELKRITPRKQGHRSNSNNPFISDFIDFFNRVLHEKDISVGGKLGEPAEPASRQTATISSSKKCS